MSHDELREMAAGYSLSALDSDELEIFESHLASRPECRTSSAEMRPLVDAFAMSNEKIEPTIELRERILASVSAEPGTPDAAGQATPERLASW